MVEVPGLEERVGSPIRVFSKDGREIRGTLRMCDEHQNLVLEGAEEYSNQKLQRRHTRLFLKGGNIRMIEI
jgi:small nuclear ribonucleoprotein (snRNP)-like protein